MHGRHLHRRALAREVRAVLGELPAPSSTPCALGLGPTTPGPRAHASGRRADVLPIAISATLPDTTPSSSLGGCTRHHPPGWGKKRALRPGSRVRDELERARTAAVSAPRAVYVDTCTVIYAYLVSTQLPVHPARCRAVLIDVSTSRATVCGCRAGGEPSGNAREFRTAVLTFECCSYDLSRKMWPESSAGARLIRRRRRGDPGKHALSRKPVRGMICSS